MKEMVSTWTKMYTENLLTMDRDDKHFQNVSDQELVENLQVGDENKEELSENDRKIVLVSLPTCCETLNELFIVERLYFIEAVRQSLVSILYHIYKSARQSVI